jgi:hypothetical protein
MGGAASPLQNHIFRAWARAALILLHTFFVGYIQMHHQKPIPYNVTLRGK